MVMCNLTGSLSHKAQSLYARAVRGVLKPFLGRWRVQDMDLASHPSLEGSLETGVDLTAPGSASQSSSSASLRSVLPDAPDAHSSTIRKMLAAQLSNQAPSSGSKVGDTALQANYVKI